VIVRVEGCLGEGVLFIDQYDFLGSVDGDAVEYHDSFWMWGGSFNAVRVVTFARYLFIASGAEATAQFMFRKGVVCKFPCFLLFMSPCGCDGLDAGGAFDNLHFGGVEDVHELTEHATCCTGDLETVFEVQLGDEGFGGVSSGCEGEVCIAVVDEWDYDL
jgi:hypothetical protein